MPKRGKPYQYQSEDSPLALANQNGITPQQLISANPGGFPFSTGQTINIPSYVNMDPLPSNIPSYANMDPLPNQTQINSPFQWRDKLNTPASSSQPTGSFFSGGTNVASYYNNNIMALNTQPTTAPSGGAQPTGTRPTPAGNTDFNQTQAAQYNAANNIPFLNQKRWDPKKRKYITVGQWLRQSKRDKRNSRSAQRPPQQQQQQAAQDYTLANSMIDFGVSAG